LKWPEPGNLRLKQKGREISRPFFVSRSNILSPPQNPEYGAGIQLAGTHPAFAPERCRHFITHPDTTVSPSEAEARLRASEERYRRLFEAAQDGILLLNAQTGRIEDVNPFLLRMLGYSLDEMLGKAIWEIGAFADTAVSKEAFRELQDRRYIRYDNLPLVTRDGVSISVEFVSTVHECGGIDVIQCNVRDNTKRHLAEIALQATTRALKMISDGNVALLNSETEGALLAEYCRIAVQTGGYSMAWIARANADRTKGVTLMAQFGGDDAAPSYTQVISPDLKNAVGVTDRALRTGEVQFSDDIPGDPLASPWQSWARVKGYRSAIAVPLRLPDEQLACLTLYSATAGIWSEPERRLLLDMAADLSFGIKALRTAIANIENQARLRESLEQTIGVISDTVEHRDPYTSGHQKRVGKICSAMAAEMGLSPDRIHGLRLAASIHDMGKMGIPAEILSKPGALSAMEFNLVKEHSAIGFNILKGVSFPWPIAQIILQHHERIDGSGYPNGLKGDDLLLESRILAVADIVEAMTSHRPYRPALGIAAALDEITAQRGVSLDAAAVDACLRIFRERGFDFGA